jgi:hypothetical protein
MAWSAGQKITAALLNAMTSAAASPVAVGTIARAKRITDTGALAVETGVLRLDDVPMYAGRYYAVGSPALRVDNTVSTDRGIVRLRCTIDGSTPTTSSTIYKRAETNDSDTHAVWLLYAPSSNLAFSVLLTANRTAGGGTVTVRASDENGLDLVVKDLGLAPADTGTVI